jgi:hypothetical protein
MLGVRRPRRLALLSLNMPNRMLITMPTMLATKAMTPVAMLERSGGTTF